MIDLHYWTTPNGHKVTIFLEETGLPYQIIPVNISTGEQFEPDFLKIAPNNRIPAIVDQDPADGGEPISVFESGAILIYLGEKTGKFLPTDLRPRAGNALQWLIGRWAVWGLWRARTTISFSTRRSSIPYAMDRYVGKPTGFMVCWTGGWRIGPSWRASIRSPTWRLIPGSSPSASSRTWTISRT